MDWKHCTFRTLNIKIIEISSSSSSSASVIVLALRYLIKIFIVCLLFENQKYDMKHWRCAIQLWRLVEIRDSPSCGSNKPRIQFGSMLTAQWIFTERKIHSPNCHNNNSYIFRFCVYTCAATNFHSIRIVSEFSNAKFCEMDFSPNRRPADLWIMT